MSAGAEGPDYRAYGEPAAEPSLGDLFGRLTNDLGELMRSEIDLARVEIREEAGKAGKAAGMLGAGSLIAYLGLALLASAAAWGLAEVMDAGWAFLLVGLVVGGVGAVLVAMGRAQLREVRPVPEETVETLKEDAQWARAQVK
jgi:Putative Actinobacterial Holin-X, holin superfamily III